jgi:hypothetical protein
MKIFALVAALAFAVPFAASAQRVPGTVAQQVQQTYHTNFPSAPAQSNGQ